MSKFIDLKGKRFNRLLVIKYAYNKEGNTYFTCICDCGKECVVRGHSLRSGKTQSCGCLTSESTSKRFTKHGKSSKRTPEYMCWVNIRARCESTLPSNYKFYKARGITVCDEWKESFEKFLNDVGERPDDTCSLDRIDPDKGYFKENCRWSSKIVQARNTHNRYIFTYNNLSMTLEQWVAFIQVNGVKSNPIGIDND